jgi:putative SOS response-associated peptidase YedK
MCGRFILTAAERELLELLGYVDPDVAPFPPRYNIAPTQPIAIVREEHHARHFALVRWGLVPAWVKDPQQFALIINARAEEIRTKPAFKNAMRYRRCLVPATGFYEWRRSPAGKSGRGARQPWLIRRRDAGILAFAGLWETWSHPDGGDIDSGCIVTTAANAVVAPIHTRMPVIIAADDFETWLTGDPDEAAALLKPAPDDLLTAFPVSDRVNRAEPDDPGLIEPVVPARTDLFDV